MSKPECYQNTSIDAHVCSYMDELVQRRSACISPTNAGYATIPNAYHDSDKHTHESGFGEIEALKYARREEIYFIF